MVAKINRGVSLYGAIIYNQRKVDEATARIIAGNRMITDLTGNPHNVMQQTLWAFESYLAANRNTEKPVLHISLNPSVDDRLTDGQFAELAREYMQKMGYGDQPYIVYLHEDIDRRHVHIVSTCVKENGEKISDAYEWNRSMKACRELENRFGLKPVADKRNELLEPYLNVRSAISSKACSPPTASRHSGSSVPCSHALTSRPNRFGENLKAHLTTASYIP